jgi:branched-chain amino acid transport system substrate-binding protein
VWSIRPAIVVAGIIAVSTWLAEPVLAADDIVIGFAVANSGTFQAYDGDPVQMAKLFIDQTNDKGGLLGRKIRFVEFDTKSDRAEGSKAGLEAVRAGAALVVVTCDYDFGAPAALQAERAGVISVFLCAEDPKAGIQGIGKLSFTASAAAQRAGAAAAEWAVAKKQWKSAYVLLDETIEYDKSVCAGFDWKFPALGGKIIGRDTFKNGDATIASQITRLAGAIKEQKIDAIMLCSFIPGGGSALRQLRAAGIDVPVLTGDAMDGSYWLSSVPNLKDFYIAVQAPASNDPRPELNSVTDAYKAKYGKLPATGFAYPIYAFLQLWAKAVTKAGTTDGKAVVAVMESFHNEATILGPRSFSNTLHIQDQIPMLIEEVQNGEGKVIDEVPLSDAIPPAVLFRQKK